MATSECICPLCHDGAAASDIDHDNRARVYCARCTTFDLTRSVHENLVGSTAAYREHLCGLARRAPSGSLLVITKDGCGYEDKETKVDRPAPDWLLPRAGERLA